MNSDIMSVYQSALSGGSTDASGVAVTPTVTPEGDTGSPVTDTKIPVEVKTEEPASDTPKEETKEADPVEAKKESLAKKFAMMTKMQRELDAKRREIEEKEKQLASIEPPKPVEKPKTPLDALRAAGFSMADYNEFLLNGGKEPPPPDPIQEKFSSFDQKVKELEERLEAERQALAQERKEKAEREHQQAMANVMANIAETAKEFDLLNTFGEDGHQVVFNTMVEFNNRYQKVLSYKEACELVEKDFEERYLDRFLGSKKLEERFLSKVKPQTTEAPAKAPKESKTLSNSHAAAAAPAEEYEKLKTDEERIQWLLKNKKLIK